MMKRLAFLLLFALACNRAETPQRKTAAPPPADPGTERAKQLITQYGCGTCHVVPGVEGAEGILGPSLAGVASRPMISNGTVQNTPQNLVQFIQNPQSLNPQSSMAPMALNTDDAETVVAYLRTLK